MAAVDVFSEVTGDGQPLLLLNGVMMTTTSWSLMTRRLATHFRCVLHDFRGQLRSPKPPGPYHIRQHVDDLLALLDRRGIDSAHLAGTSYGGEVAMQFALDHPRRVRSLAVIASVSHIEPALRVKVERWRDAHRDELYELSAPDNFSPAFINDAIVAAGRERLRMYPDELFRAFRDLCDSFLELDLTDRLHEIAVPTLVVAGELDTLKPVHYSRIIAERISGADLHVVEGAGHAVVIEKADAVSEMLLGWHARRTAA